MLAGENKTRRKISHLQNAPLCLNFDSVIFCNCTNLTLHHRAMVLACPCTNVVLCHCAMVSPCRFGTMPFCNCATVHSATIEYYHNGMMAWCQNATLAE